METIRQDLRDKVGIRPSNHWWTDCVSALSLQRSSPPQADNILEQILHHDLRDVVRTFGDNGGNGNNDNSNSDAPAVQLRQAIRRSQQSSQNFRAELPDTFLLLVQVEEFLDVSVNAMARLEHGPTDVRVDPAPIGNQSKRCLKLAYTDGYDSQTGRSFYDENQPPEAVVLLVAMEMQPIPDLSVHSRAGLKVLIKGPLTIRRGVALWHPGNTTAIGGSVAALMEMQTQALQQAKQLAGVGIDPTVRALIGTQPMGDEEENNDEGEQESGDVVSAAPQTRAPPAAPIVRPPAAAAAVSTPVATPSPSILPVRDIQPAPVPASHRPSAVSQQTPPPSNSPNPHASTSNTIISSNRPHASNGNHQMTTTMASRSSNPYASSRATIARQNDSVGSSNSSLSPATTTSDASFRTTPNGPPNSAARAGGTIRALHGTASKTHTVRTSGNPYVRSHSGHAATASRTSTSLLDAGNVGDPFDTVVILDDDKDENGASVPMDIDPTVPETVGDGTTQSRIAFNELFLTLQRLVKSTPEKYRQATPREWLVEVKVEGSRVDFNIFSRKVDGKKKYEYWLLFKFGAGGNTSQLVTCQIDSAMAETHFGHSPSELRKLRKTNSAEAQKICKDGGRSLLARLVNPRIWRVGLVDLPEDFWKQTERPLDAKQPILTIRPFES